jgi:hypothetical protein
MKTEKMVDVVAALGITMELQHIPTVRDVYGWQPARSWNATLHYQGRTFRTKVHQGDRKVGHAKEPVTTADVVRSLCDDTNIGERPYREFLSDFGYDDEVRWRDLHEHCQKEGVKFRQFIGAAYDRCLHAEH